MNILAREKLVEVVRLYGSDIGLDSSRMRAALNDLCGESARDCRREIAALTAVVEEHQVANLIAWDDSVPLQVLIGRLIRQLADERGITVDLAEWAVVSWGTALDLITPSQANTYSVASASTSPVAALQSGAPSASQPFLSPTGTSGSVSSNQLGSAASTSSTNPLMGGNSSGPVRTAAISAAPRPNITGKTVSILIPIIVIALIAFYWLRSPLPIHGKLTSQSTNGAQPQMQLVNSSERSRKLSDRAHDINNKTVMRLLLIERNFAGGTLTQQQATQAYSDLRPSCATALSLSKSAIALDHHNQDAWLQSIRSVYYRGDYATADKMMTEALNSFPHNSDLETLKIRLDTKLSQHQSTVRRDP